MMMNNTEVTREDMAELLASLAKAMGPRDYDGDLPAKCPGSNLATMMPAVSFEGFNIYTQNGVTTVPSDIYNKILDINNSIVSDHNNYTDLMVTGAIGINVSRTSLNMAIESFMLTVDNIYKVFLANMNSLYTIINGPEVFTAAPEYNKSACCLLLSNTLYAYLNMKDTFDKEMVAGFIATCINNLGYAIYNVARSQLTDLIINAKTEDGSEPPIEDMFNTLNSFFSCMMGDMTFEISIFINNLESIKPVINRENEIQNNIENAIEYDIF